MMELINKELLNCFVKHLYPKCIFECDKKGKVYYVYESMQSKNYIIWFDRKINQYLYKIDESWYTEIEALKVIKLLTFV